MLLDLENVLHQPDDHVFTGQPCCADPASHADVSALAVRYHDYHSWVCEGVAGRRLDAIHQVAGRHDYALGVAIAPLLCHVAFLPEMVGVTTRAVGTERDAADNYLLDVAEHLAAASGFTRFVVASGDRAFAPLARRFETIVVARAYRSLHHDLRAAAAKIHYLDDPGFVSASPSVREGLAFGPGSSGVLVR